MTRWLLGGALVLGALTMPFVLVLFLVPLAGGAQAALAVNPCLAPVAGSVAASGSGFRLPLTGRYVISSPYGMRVHPVTGQSRMHAGVDLSMRPHGGPVLSMGAGTVTRLSSGGGGGNVVVVDHGNGLVSKYMHLQSFSVRSGQQVAPGTQVGVEGATGRVTGPHLHWEVWVNGRHVDPVQWAASQGLTMNGTAPAVSAATEALARTPVVTPVSASRTPPTQIGAWKGEQIVNAGHVVAAGKALGLDAWSITVAVMTAMGESSLRNIDHGDGAGPDSRGIFQQRANGAWGSYQDRMTPRTAATNFFRALQQVPGYHDLAPTIAAHRVQRNANPHYYQPFWTEAVAVVAALEADPDLLTTLAADGSAASCSAGAGGGVAGAVPPGPAGECPATGRSSERGLKPRSLRGLRCGVAAFPGVTTTYGVGSRSLSTSDHPAGYAVDFMIENYRTPEGRAYGWQLAEWTKAHAPELGVKYVIFDMKIWQARNADAGWQPYRTYGPNPNDNLAHRNHVHVSYLRD